MGEPLTNEQMEQAATLVLAFLTFGALAFGLLAALYFRVMEWRLDRHEERESVNTSEAEKPAAPALVMSRSEPAPRPSELAAPSVQGRTDDRAKLPETIPLPTREQMVDGCRELRRRGFTREEGRAFFKRYGIPLGNDVWAAAAPPEDEPEYVTPIAGRRTKARYYEDEPALEFEQPPA